MLPVIPFICLLTVCGAAFDGPPSSNEAVQESPRTNIREVIGALLHGLQGSGFQGGPGGNRGGGCPLCDSSVYSYCNQKLQHDACCCYDPYGAVQQPYGCQYADCSYIHANSCPEHQLITTCCCDNYLRR